MAVSAIFIVAPIVVFLLFQRYFRQMGEGGLDTVSIK
jgi:ABC-type glycerol-3-phosphate transport system permease component